MDCRRNVLPQPSVKNKPIKRHASIVLGAEHQSPLSTRWRYTDHFIMKTIEVELYPNNINAEDNVSKHLPDHMASHLSKMVLSVVIAKSTSKPTDW
jgi:hypothetical protein